MKHAYFRSLIGLISLLSLISCADTSDPLGIRGKTAQEIYQEANASLNNKTYDKSIKLYTALEANYPYGIYAQQGLLDLAYAQYQYDKYQEALDTIEEFITTYTTSPNMDYALYLKGYINYRHSDGFFDKITRQAPSELDNSGLKEAYKAFDELIKTYPKSKYVADATLKINEIVNELARSEMLKAHYYMGIRAYMAAINRTNVIITMYGTTNYVEEALAIEIVAYNNLGDDKLSSDTKEVLNLNYPKSKYLKKSWRYSDSPWYQIY